jgi:hypothetical protein
MDIIFPDSHVRGTLPESNIQLNNLTWIGIIKCADDIIYSLIILSSPHAFSVFKSLIDFNISSAVIYPFILILGIYEMRFYIQEVVIMSYVIRSFIQFFEKKYKLANRNIWLLLTAT